MENLSSETSEINPKDKDLQILQDYFLKISGSSEISMSNFIENHWELGFPYSSRLLPSIFRLLDLNMTNRVELNNLLSFASLALGNDLEAKAKIIFKLFSSGSDIITEKSFDYQVRCIHKCFDFIIGYSKPYQLSVIKNLFFEINLKKNSSIDFEEFQEAYYRKNKIIVWADFFLFAGFSDDRIASQRFSVLKSSDLEKNMKFGLEVLDFNFNRKDHELKELLQTTPEEFLEAGSYRSTFEIGRNYSGDLPYAPETFNPELFSLAEPISLPLTVREHILTALESIKKQDAYENTAPFHKDLNLLPSKQPFKLEYNHNLILSIFVLLKFYFKNYPVTNNDTTNEIMVPLSHSSYQTPKKLQIFKPFSFSSITELFSLTFADILHSFSVSSLLSKLINTKFSEALWFPSSGKSGSFFHITEDQKFIIKSIRSSEFEFLLNIMPEYVKFLKSNPNTLISKIFGLYRIKSYQGCSSDSMNFVIMNYVFSQSKALDTVIDLKGCAAGRQAESLPGKTQYFKETEFEQSGVKILIQNEEKTQLLERIRIDCEFLAKINVMDNSLLIGIEQLDVDFKPNSENHAYFSIDHTLIYYFGIIDILTQYSLKKKFENFFRTKIETTEISCIPSSEYSSRFLKYIPIIFN